MRNECDKARDEKRRSEMSSRRQILDGIIARAPHILGRDEVELVAASLVRGLDADTARRLCQHRGWKPPVPQYSTPDFRYEIEQHVPSLTGAELTGLIIELCLVGETYISTYALDSKPERILLMAGLYGVQVEG